MLNLTRQLLCSPVLQCLSGRRNWKHLVPPLVKSQESAKEWKISWALQRHWSAESREMDHCISLLYPWWPRDCQGLGTQGLSHCAVTMQPQVTMEDGNLAGVALQCLWHCRRSQITERQQSHWAPDLHQLGLVTTVRWTSSPAPAL